MKHIRRQCDACPEWFTPAQKNQRFCSPTCSNRWHQKQHRDRAGETTHVPEQRECRQCGNFFETRQHNQVLCSDYCHEKEGNKEGREYHGWQAAQNEGVFILDDDPRAAFDAMKIHAKRLNRAWDMSYDDWWRKWAPVWDKRGAYGVYRLDRSKGYSPLNTVVMTRDVATVYYEPVPDEGEYNG